MKYSLVLVTAIILFTLISCNQAKKDTAETQQLPALPLNQKQTTAVSLDQTKPVNAETEKQPSVIKDNSAIKLNPPHGEPNHRCDIPVGAPLNSPPVNAPQISTNNQIQAAPIQNSNTAPVIPNNSNAPTIENAKRINSTQTLRTVTPNTGTKPRLNPPHGQPWHRCEIAVGSPLP